MLSQPFSKAAAEVSTSEIDPMDFDSGSAQKRRIGSAQKRRNDERDPMT